MQFISCVVNLHLEAGVLFFSPMDLGWFILNLSYSIQYSFRQDLLWYLLNPCSEQSIARNNRFDFASIFIVGSEIQKIFSSLYAVYGFNPNPHGYGI
jgi:hypothetical protein